ncbi:MAG TPA: DUF4340 domain-containing protein [Candidatus Udaeobacter sp.]|nr:DUF4340 domain-containing protein [Candidatus Udaeobacter sp.]
MSGKNIRSLALVFGALVALVLILERPWAKGERNGEGKALYPKFSAEKVDRIEVFSTQDTVKLARKDKDKALWVIEGINTYPADTAAINRALAAVPKWTANQVVSKNPAKFGVYEVDSTGASVKVFAGGKDPVVDVIVGKTTAEGGTYFRPVNAEQVYASSDRVRSLFVKLERSWQDRKMFDVEPAQITRLKVEHGDSTAVFEKNPDGSWALKEPEAFPVKTDDVDGLLNGLCKLIANGMPDTLPTPSQAGFDHPKLRVRGERLDGTGIELVVGHQAWDGLYYARNSERDWVYKIASYRVDPYFKDLHSMKAPLPTPAPVDSLAAPAAPPHPAAKTP